MLIDWFTVAAQVVNFLVLVWLLKRFLYRPILNAIDEREKRVAAQVSAAAAEHSKAETERATYEARNRELDSEREQLLTAARKAANEERTTLLQQVRAENDRLRERLTAELVEQREEITRTVGVRLENDLFDTVRRLMTDLSDRNLEDAILSVFVRRLQSLGDEDRASLRRDLAGKSSGEGTGATVRTAFELSPAQRSSLEAALKQLAPDAGPLRYQRDPNLVGGIEMIGNGHRLSWSMDGYLGALRQKVNTALKSVAES